MISSWRVRWLRLNGFACLGGLPAETLARVRSIAWVLAICFAAVTALSWRYAFTTPIVFSTLITVCLTAAAWLSAKTS